MTSIVKLRVVTGLSVCLLCFSLAFAQAQVNPTPPPTSNPPEAIDPGSPRPTIKGDTTPPRGTVNPQTAPRTGIRDTMPPRGVTEPQTQPRTGIRNDTTPPGRTGNPRTDQRTGIRPDSTRNTNTTGNWGTTGGTFSMASISDWPESSKTAAQTMIQKYGQPQEHTTSMLIWRNNGPWHKTVVTRYETQHDFPMPHKDVLEQVIMHSVPADYLDDLARFDGSISVNRTEGTLSARCDKEENNFLALNLAHDVITGKRTSNDARAFLAQAVAGSGTVKSEYTSGLMFKTEMKSGDADKPATGVKAKDSNMDPKNKNQPNQKGTDQKKSGTGTDNKEGQKKDQKSSSGGGQ